MEDHTEPDGSTADAEHHDAGSSHAADRPATEEEETMADRVTGSSDPEVRREVAEHEKEMMETGAHLKGEGAIEGS